MSTRRGAERAPVTTRLHVETFGGHVGDSGHPTVVLCHGFGGSARNFRPQARALQDSVRFVLYDARGHARSAKLLASSDGCAFGMDALVEDLQDVIDEFGGERVVLGGLSLGAATALAYALERPSRVSGLLLAAYPNPSATLRAWALGFASSIEREGIARAGDGFVWGESSRFDAPARALIRQGFLEHSEVALSAMLRQTVAEFEPIEQLRERLREFRIPTRIVVGSEDAQSVEACSALARLIPISILSVLDGAGHVANLERVSEFNEELRRLVFQATRCRP